MSASALGFEHMTYCDKLFVDEGRDALSPWQRGYAYGMRSSECGTARKVLRRVVFGLTLFVVFTFHGCGGGGGGGGGGGSSVSASSGNVPSGGGSQTYDTRVGGGAESDGTPILTKDANARYIYWNPTHANASDANAGTDPSRPKATPASAWSALRSGYGDWLLMAQGVTYSGGFGQIVNRSGLSASYPIVVTTYDPADPANVSKMRAGHVTMGTAQAQTTLSGYNFTGQNIVFENIDFSGPLVARVKTNAVSFLNWTEQTTSTTPNILFHNVRFLRHQVQLQSTGVAGVRMSNFIFRHCAFAYVSDSTEHAQGLYLDGTAGITVEDSVFYHNGWSDDGTRDTATNIPTEFNHNVYVQNTTYGLLFRRNVNGHASESGLMMRGDGVANENVFANNPVNFTMGGGTAYNTARPSGVTYEARNNVIVGSENINTANPRGFGIGFENTRDGGVFDSNLIVNVGTNSTANQVPVSSTWLSTEFNLPTYFNMTNNIVWRWAPNFTTNSYGNNAFMTRIKSRQYPAQLHFTYSGNVIHNDTAPTGDNRQTPVTAYPDPTRDTYSYAAANGYASETALWQAMVANPKAAWAKSIGDYIRAGYGR
jgi:hypothetical protein